MNEWMTEWMKERKKERKKEGLSDVFQSNSLWVNVSTMHSMHNMQSFSLMKYLMHNAQISSMFSRPELNSYCNGLKWEIHMEGETKVWSSPPSDEWRGP